MGAMINLDRSFEELPLDLAIDELRRQTAAFTSQVNTIYSKDIREMKKRVVNARQEVKEGYDQRLEDLQAASHLFQTRILQFRAEYMLPLIAKAAELSDTRHSVSFTAQHHLDPQREEVVHLYNLARSAFKRLRALVTGDN